MNYIIFLNINLILTKIIFRSPCGEHHNPDTRFYATA